MPVSIGGKPYKAPPEVYFNDHNISEYHVEVGLSAFKNSEGMLGTEPESVFGKAAVDHLWSVMKDALILKDDYDTPEKKPPTESILKKVIKNAHVFEKHAEDWYLEDSWVSAALFRDVEFPTGQITDPFCGIGRILKAAKAYGHAIDGWDIVNRTNYPAGGNHEFLGVVGDAMDYFHVDIKNPSFLDIGHGWSVVSNPPYGIVDEILKRLAFEQLTERCALFMPLAYLSGKAKLFDATPLSHVLVCSPRPNCLPGDLKLKTEVKGSKEQKENGSGFKDFAWYIFDPGFTGYPQMRTLYKKSDGDTAVLALPKTELDEGKPLPTMHPADFALEMAKQISKDNGGLAIDYPSFEKMKEYMDQPVPSQSFEYVGKPIKSTLLIGGMPFTDAVKGVVFKPDGVVDISINMPDYWGNALQTTMSEDNTIGIAIGGKGYADSLKEVGPLTLQTLSIAKPKGHPVHILSYTQGGHENWTAQFSAKISMDHGTSLVSLDKDQWCLVKKEDCA